MGGLPDGVVGLPCGFGLVAFGCDFGVAAAIALGAGFAEDSASDGSALMFCELLSDSAGMDRSAVSMGAGLESPSVVRSPISLDDSSWVAGAVSANFKSGFVLSFVLESEGLESEGLESEGLVSLGLVSLGLVSAGSELDLFEPDLLESACLDSAGFESLLCESLFFESSD